MTGHHDNDNHLKIDWDKPIRWKKYPTFELKYVGKTPEGDPVLLHRPTTSGNSPWMAYVVRPGDLEDIENIPPPPVKHTIWLGYWFDKNQRKVVSSTYTTDPTNNSALLQSTSLFKFLKVIKIEEEFCLE